MCRLAWITMITSHIVLRPGIIKGKNQFKKLPLRLGSLCPGLGIIRFILLFPSYIRNQQIPVIIQETFLKNFISRKLNKRP